MSKSVKRSVRVANCSGAQGDPGYQMLRQITQGPVDFVTGDFLAEVNLAQHAEAVAAKQHDGYSTTAMDGMESSLTEAARRGVKIVHNGGALNPEGMAIKLQSSIDEKGLGMKVAWVSGDDLTPRIKDLLDKTGNLPAHFDSDKDVALDKRAMDFKRPGHDIVSAHAYLGARAIVSALEAGADIVICGRVADASPVIAAAWWWHSWKATDYDYLARALVGGHLIECSAYVTGSNFSGFDEYPLETFIDLPFGICEIAHDGDIVVTKHDGTNGLVNVDTVTCQLLYELQGDVYLNSDVKAYLEDVKVEAIGPDRVRVTGVRGGPPPPTTKLAIFYKGGYEAQLLLNAAGYATDQKYQLWKRQFENTMRLKGVADKFDVVEFEHIGVPERNPKSQLRATTYFRLVVQASQAAPVQQLLAGFQDFGMQHFSGMHMSLDFRTALPRPILAYWPAMWKQDDLDEYAHILATNGKETQSISAGHPPTYEPLDGRANYDTHRAIDISSLGPSRTVPLGDIALGRSGDKGGNINIGLYVRDVALWDWFRSYLTSAAMKQLIGDDWRESYSLERCEFPNLYAVHFVIYGILGRGVSSTVKLDCLGKGFADYIRAREIEVPTALLAQSSAKERGR